MADMNNLKIETEQELIEKIMEEVEVLESIYADENVVLQQPTPCEVVEPDASTSSSGELGEEKEENVAIGNFMVQIELDIKPNTGFDEAKIGLLVQCRIQFDQYYPYRAPQMSFTAKKGLDECQYDEIINKFNAEAKQLSLDRREGEDETGILYDLHDKMREILSKYNDTVQGRCAVCLENFSGLTDEEEMSQEEPLQGFTDRADLVRIGHCFHRFHLICVYRDWFMERVSEQDKYGVVIDYELPEEKKCPICRRHVQNQEVDYVMSQKDQHPEVEDGGYSDKQIIQLAQ